jgi:hypothetical protein
MGAVSHFGTVQPHEPLHVAMSRGSVPVFVTVKTHAPSAPCLMVP